MTSNPADERTLGRAWLLLAAMTFVMLVIGGLTRLTGSGLSITEWKPIVGALPPLSHADWVAEFAKYQQSPQFQQTNAYMTLDGFRTIFLWEWAHRLWGRLLGLPIVVPLVLIALRGRLRRDQLARSGVLFAVLGLQGFAGWFMVKSGLVDVPRVSPYRLALHLFLAMSFAAIALVYARRALGAEIAPVPRRWAFAALGLVGLQMILGAFTAGMHAGHLSNEWPKMMGAWVPAGMGQLAPAWLNLLENPLTVYWIHRLFAWLAAAACVAVAVRLWRSGARGPASTIGAVVTAQVGLGIAVVVLGVPISLASAHQACAMLLWSVLVWVVPGRAPAAESSPRSP